MPSIDDALRLFRDFHSPSSHPALRGDITQFRTLLAIPDTPEGVSRAHRLRRQLRRTLSKPIRERLTEGLRQVSSSIVKVPATQVILPPIDDPAHPSLSAPNPKRLRTIARFSSRETATEEQGVCTQEASFTAIGTPDSKGRLRALHPAALIDEYIASALSDPDPAKPRVSYDISQPTSSNAMHPDRKR